MLGVAVGDWLGFAVLGVAEGLEVGDWLGFSVGFAVGYWLGDADGLSVGDWLGFSVLGVAERMDVMGLDVGISEQVVTRHQFCLLE